MPRWLSLLVTFALPLCAETGYEAWLRYKPLDRAAAAAYAHLPAVVYATGSTPVIGGRG